MVWRHEDPYQHHDTRRLSDGAVYATFTELDDAAKAGVNGGIPGSETEGGPFGEAIRKVNEAGKTVWEWHFQTLGLDSYPLYRNANRWSYGHTNTVCPLTDGTYLVSSKNLNLLFIVDPISSAVKWSYQNDAMSGRNLIRSPET